MNPSAAYLLWLGLTLAVEATIVAALAPRGARRTTLAVALLANLCTHPLATLAAEHTLLPWMALELLVAAAEAAALARLAGLRPARAALAAGAANLSTALLAVGLGALG